MATSSTYPTRPGRRPARQAVIAAGCVLAGFILPGCHWDSFMDPSVVGRWEETPAVVPILETLAPIESDGGALVEFTDVTPEDLQVQPDIYRLSAGDQISIQAWDVVIAGQPEFYDRVVDPSGYVEVPQLGRVYVSGLTEEEAADLLRRRFGQFVADPLVSVNLVGRRAQAYHLQGAIAQPGRYQIPAADYRLLEALIAGGGVNPHIVRYVDVIRQIPLSEGVAPGRQEPPGEPRDSGRTPLTEPPAGEDLIDIIEDLTGDEDDGGGGAPAPGVLGMERRFAMGQPGGGADQPEPMVDLIEEDEPRRPAISAPEPARAAGGGRWMFLNGEWVRGYPRPVPGRDAAPPGGVADRGEPPLVTQRVIRVPIDPLLSGDARYNIVVRPGDVIRVPQPDQGNIYLGGQLVRPGVYQLPAVGRLTLTRAVTAAGGLSGIAIPERVDLTRMVGPDLQATIMLDFRAIAEGTQPDVFLKADDHVNVGTNFWALPLAVIRNGFRASYGFGFLLDRNFGNDVFGAPPTNFR